VKTTWSMRWALIREILRGTVVQVTWDSRGTMTVELEPTEYLRERLTK